MKGGRQGAGPTRTLRLSTLRRGSCPVPGIHWGRESSWGRQAGQVPAFIWVGQERMGSVATRPTGWMGSDFSIPPETLPVPLGFDGSTGPTLPRRERAPRRRSSPTPNAAAVPNADRRTHGGRGRVPRGRGPSWASLCVQGLRFRVFLDSNSCAPCRGGREEGFPTHCGGGPLM